MNIHTFDKIKHKLKSKTENESGIAMIFALILLTILVLLSVVVTAAVAGQTAGSTAYSKYEAQTAVANQGLEDLLKLANNAQNAVQLENLRTNCLYWQHNRISSTEPSTTHLKDTGYVLWTQRVVLPGNDVAYYVYSKGYIHNNDVASCTQARNKEGVTLRALFEGTTITANSGHIVPGVDAVGNPRDYVAYKLTKEGSWSKGLGGTSKDGIGVTFNGTSKLYTANSLQQSTTNPTVPPAASLPQQGALVTVNNGVRLTAAQHGVAAIQGPTLQSCVPANLCGNVRIGQNSSPMVLSWDATGDPQAAACSGTIANLTVSSTGTLPTTSGLCYNNVTFSGSSQVPSSFTKTNPMIIYVRGNVTINDNVQVNTNNVPATLRIIQIGGDGTNNLTAGNGSRVNALTASNNVARCTLNGNAKWFGGMVCYSVTLNDSSSIYLDEDVRSLTNNSTSPVVWSRSVIEQYN